MNRIKSLCLASALAFAGAFLLSGCVPSVNSLTPPLSGTSIVSFVVPSDSATNVGVGDLIRVSFSEAMDASTMIPANFSVATGGTAIAGSVTYEQPTRSAVFAPASTMLYGTMYTVTVTVGAKDTEGMPLAASSVSTFSTASIGTGPSPVRLGTAGKYVVLAKTAISTVPASVITGDIGLSPAAESYMTGFSQTKATGYSTAPQVTGFMYAADMTPPTPSNMTTAISDMEAAYTDAAGRPTPDYTNLLSGSIGGQNLAPGLYTWSSSVSVAADLTLSGGANDVWIFQMSGDLSVGNAVQLILAGGARAKNIFWQVAGEATLGTTSHFEGIILSQTAITMNTGATMNGRALAQSQVALDTATITGPAQ